MASRPSPSESATSFPVGTHRKGNDGNMYAIVENKNGVHRWQKSAEKMKATLGTTLSWTLGTPITTARVYNEAGELEEVPSSVWSSKLVGFKPSDRVVVLKNEGEPVVTEPILVNSIRGAFAAIAKGLARKVPSTDADWMFEKIENFRKASDRKSIKAKWAEGSLKYQDLLGDHAYFEGSLQRKNGVWNYDLGS